MAVNLVKGQRINLKKSNGDALESFCVGANWGAIEKKGFFGGKKLESVDLDLSVVTFDENGRVNEIIYYGNLKGRGITHSGDDLDGDLDGDDGLDNEIIELNLKDIPHSTKNIFFILNSYKGQDFATIPYASIRLYEGTPTQVKNVVATYNVASENKFAGYVSMILGKIYRRGDEWKFSAIGEPTKDKNLENTIRTVQSKLI